MCFACQTASTARQLGLWQNTLGRRPVHVCYLMIAHHVPPHLIIAWLGFPLLPLPILTLALGLLGWGGLASIIWLRWSLLLLLRLCLSLKVLPERCVLTGHVAESRSNLARKGCGVGAADSVSV